MTRLAGAIDLRKGGRALTKARAQHLQKSHRCQRGLSGICGFGLMTGGAITLQRAVMTRERPSVKKFIRRFLLPEKERHAPAYDGEKTQNNPRATPRTPTLPVIHPVLIALRDLLLAAA